jgi:DNA mismatch endonuclease Vsr
MSIWTRPKRRGRPICGKSAARPVENPWTLFCRRSRKDLSPFATSERVARQVPPEFRTWVKLILTQIMQDTCNHYGACIMADNLTRAQRRRTMQAIRAWNTKPEIITRKFLRAHGLRFRLHDASLPGVPDVVLRKYRTVIFIHGCFWHQHGCARSVLPKSRQSYWHPKLENNARRHAWGLPSALNAVASGRSCRPTNSIG